MAGTLSVSRRPSRIAESTPRAAGSPASGSPTSRQRAALHKPEPQPHPLPSPPSCASAAASPATSVLSGRSSRAPHHASRWLRLFSPDAAAPPPARPISAAPPRSSPAPPRRSVVYRRLRLLDPLQHRQHGLSVLRQKTGQPLGVLPLHDVIWFLHDGSPFDKIWSSLILNRIRPENRRSNLSRKTGHPPASRRHRPVMSQTSTRVAHTGRRLACVRFPSHALSFRAQRGNPALR